MQSVSFLRHSGWVSPSDFHDTIFIIGCGAIGSRVALECARMGVRKFELWDMDTVEAHNLPNQVYMPRDIGTPKVEALTRILMEFNPEIKVVVHNEPFTHATHGSMIDGPLVIATDNMNSRFDITDTFAYNAKIPRVFEARLGFDYAEIHIINPMNSEQVMRWKDSLKDDSEIPDGPCSLRICATLVGVVSSTLVHFICATYASQRSGYEWKYPFMTRFSMRDTLYVREMFVGG